MAGGAVAILAVVAMTAGLATPAAAALPVPQYATVQVQPGQLTGTYLPGGKPDRHWVSIKNTGTLPFYYSDITDEGFEDGQHAVRDPADQPSNACHPGWAYRLLTGDSCVIKLRLPDTGRRVTGTVTLTGTNTATPVSLPVDIQVLPATHLDMSPAQLDEPGPYRRGDTVSWTVTVTNNDPEPHFAALDVQTNSWAEDLQYSTPDGMQPYSPYADSTAAFLVPAEGSVTVRFTATVKRVYPLAAWDPVTQQYWGSGTDLQVRTRFLANPCPEEFDQVQRGDRQCQANDTQTAHSTLLSTPVSRDTGNARVVFTKVPTTVAVGQLATATVQFHNDSAFPLSVVEVFVGQTDASTTSVIAVTSLATSPDAPTNVGSGEGSYCNSMSSCRFVDVPAGAVRTVTVTVAPQLNTKEPATLVAGSSYDINELTDTHPDDDTATSGPVTSAPAASTLKLSQPPHVQTGDTVLLTATATRAQGPYYDDPIDLDPEGPNDATGADTAELAAHAPRPVLPGQKMFGPALPIVGRSVTFVVSGKTYHATTDSKGVARAKVPVTGPARTLHYTASVPADPATATHASQWNADTSTGKITVVPETARLAATMPATASAKTPVTLKVTVTDPAAHSYNGPAKEPGGKPGDITRTYVQTRATIKTSSGIRVVATNRTRVTATANGVGTARPRLALPEGTYQITTSIVAADGTPNDYYTATPVSSTLTVR
jgi:hypothetical protein